MGYRAIVVVVVGLHFAYLAFVVVGGYLALRWPRLIWVHLAACAWAVAIVAAPGLLCPLTAAENWARRHAGMPTDSHGFINQYVQGVLYPARFTPLVQAVIAVLVAVSWVLYLRRRRAAHAAT